jgi:hypothetical protein
LPVAVNCFLREAVSGDNHFVFGLFFGEGGAREDGSATTSLTAGCCQAPSGVEQRLATGRLRWKSRRDDQVGSSHSSGSQKDGRRALRSSLTVSWSGKGLQLSSECRNSFLDGKVAKRSSDFYNALPRWTNSGESFGSRQRPSVESL